MRANERQARVHDSRDNGGRDNNRDTGGAGDTAAGGPDGRGAGKDDEGADIRDRDGSQSLQTGGGTISDDRRRARGAGDEARQFQRDMAEGRIHAEDAEGRMEPGFCIREPGQVRAYDIISYGADGVEGGEDENADITN